MQETDTKEYRYPIRDFALIAAALTLVWWFVGTEGPHWVACGTASAGEAGDQFGMVNALFSALALAGVIWTILLQRTEMRQMAKHIKGLETDQERAQRTAVISSKIQAHAAMASSSATIMVNVTGTTRASAVGDCREAQGELKACLDELASLDNEDGSKD